MSMEFSPEVEAKIRMWVESGRYRDANAVVGEAMRLLVERERLEQERHDELGGDLLKVAPDLDRESPSRG